MTNVTSVLSSMLSWITTILSTFTADDTLKLFIYIPISAFVIFTVINIIKSLFR